MNIRTDICANEFLMFIRNIDYSTASSINLALYFIFTWLVVREYISFQSKIPYIFLSSFLFLFYLYPYLYLSLSLFLCLSLHFSFRSRCSLRFSLMPWKNGSLLDGIRTSYAGRRIRWQLEAITRNPARLDERASRLQTLRLLSSSTLLFSFFPFPFSSFPSFFSSYHHFRELKR